MLLVVYPGGFEPCAAPCNGQGLFNAIETRSHPPESGLRALWARMILAALRAPNPPEAIEVNKKSTLADASCSGPRGIRTVRSPHVMGKAFSMPLRRAPNPPKGGCVCYRPGFTHFHTALRAPNPPKAIEVNKKSTLADAF